MRRRRITEMFPFLLPIRKWQRKLFFYMKMYFDGNKYSREKRTENFKYTVYKTKSLMVNKSSGFDIKYQINKVHNLQLASNTINHTIIKPNEVFSFWQLVRHTEKYGEYKDGLNLVNGKIVGTYGGGLCQLSNLLFWLFLHTPLTIIERHTHEVQNFAPEGDLPIGIDATISEGWKDLKVKNETQSTFQIIISFDNKYIHGSILSNIDLNNAYEIYNGEIKYYKEKNEIIEEASIYRRRINKNNGVQKEVFLYANKTKINYELSESIKILGEATEMEKKKIAVLFGGCSPEYSISLQSAYGVLSNLDKEKYYIIPIGITKKGQWFKYLGDIKNIEIDLWHKDKKNLVPTIISPDREMGGIVEYINNEVKHTRIDGAFPILHGKNGEDGTVQGLIQMAGIPLIGCDLLSSALGMDKNKAHKIAYAAGIEVPKGIVINKYMDKEDIYSLIEELEYPLFIKPVNAGSSYGITKVYKKDNLLNAIYTAHLYDKEVIIEENIEGFEVCCGILGNEELSFGRIGEIELVGDFLDYEDKYTNRRSKIHIPARIDVDMEKEIQNAAAIIYRALGCSGLARVDMFLTPDNRIVFNEINTIPGLTPVSTYSNMLRESRIPYKKFLDMLIELGIKR